MGHTDTTSPREKLKKPVYLLVVLTYLAVVLPWQTMHQNWDYKNQLIASISEQEIAQAEKTILDTYHAAKAKKSLYTPEDYFHDLTILVPIRERFRDVDGLRNDFSQVSGLARGTIENLITLARDNYPTTSSSYRDYDDWRINILRWDDAYIKAERPAGSEPISISGEAFVNFLRWILMAHLKFLPFGCILIVVNNWQKQLSTIQELYVKPRFVVFCILGGPIGILVHYASSDQKSQLNYALKRARFMQQRGRWKLSRDEELEFQKMLGIDFVEKTKTALALSYFILVITTLSSFQELQFQRIMLSAGVSISQDQSNRGSDRSSISLGAADAIEYHLLNSPNQQQVAAWVKDIDQIDSMVSKNWFLPPSLAPPLTRR